MNNIYNINYQMDKKITFNKDVKITKFYIDFFFKSLLLQILSKFYNNFPNF